MRALSAVVLLFLGLGFWLFSDGGQGRSAVEPPTRPPRVAPGGEEPTPSRPGSPAAIREAAASPYAGASSRGAAPQVEASKPPPGPPAEAPPGSATLVLAPRTPAGPQLLAAELQLLDDVGARRGGRPIPGGKLEFAGLEPGRYRIHYPGDDFSVLQPSWVEAAFGEHREVVVLGHAAETLPVYARTLSGRPLAHGLREAGSPMPLSAVATAGPLRLGETAPAEYTPPFVVSRRVELLGDRKPAGQLVDELELLQPPARFHLSLCLGRRVIATEPAVPGLGSFSFEVDVDEVLGALASLRWTFLRSDGESAGPGEAWFEDEPEHRFTIGEDGVLALAGLPAPRGTIRILLPGSASIAHGYRILPGAHDEDTFFLGPTTHLSGVALRGDEPAAGAIVILSEIERHRLHPSQRAAADGRGRFRFEGVNPGLYALRLVEASTANYTRVEVEGEPLEDIRVHQRVPSILRLSSTTELLRVDVKDSHGLLLQTLHLGSSPVEVALVPGTYTLVLWPTGFRSREEEVVIGETAQDLVLR